MKQATEEQKLTDQEREILENRLALTKKYVAEFAKDMMEPFSSFYEVMVDSKGALIIFFFMDYIMIKGRDRTVKKIHDHRLGLGGQERNVSYDWEINVFRIDINGVSFKKNGLCYCEACQIARTKDQEEEMESDESWQVDIHVRGSDSQEIPVGSRDEAVYVKNLLMAWLLDTEDGHLEAGQEEKSIMAMRDESETPLTVGKSDISQQ
jgi:hypothetical protein